MFRIALTTYGSLLKLYVLLILETSRSRIMKSNLRVRLNFESLFTEGDNNNYIRVTMCLGAHSHDLGCA